MMTMHLFSWIGIFPMAMEELDRNVWSFPEWTASLEMEQTVLPAGSTVSQKTIIEFCNAYLDFFPNEPQDVDILHGIVQVLLEDSVGKTIEDFLGKGSTLVMDQLEDKLHEVVSEEYQDERQGMLVVTKRSVCMSLQDNLPWFMRMTVRRSRMEAESNQTLHSIPFSSLMAEKCTEIIVNEALEASLTEEKHFVRALEMYVREYFESAPCGAPQSVLDQRLRNKLKDLNGSLKY